MAKIVIVAPTDARADVDDAVKMLKGAGHDVDIEEPTPKSLLHIVLGLLGPNAYGFGPGYAFSPGAEVADEVEPAAGGGEAEEEVTANDDDFNFESRKVTVDGELILAERIQSPTSKLLVDGLVRGAKTTYSLNESIFSFWPADVEHPAQRIDVVVERHRTSIELPVEKSDGVAKLLVGDDLISMFSNK